MGTMTLFTLLFCLSIYVLCVSGSPRSARRPRTPVIKTPKTPWKFDCVVPEPAENRTWPRSNSPASSWHQDGDLPIMLPILIDFILTESTTRENDDIMMDIFQRLNSFLGERIKTDSLALDAMLYSLELPTHIQCLKGTPVACGGTIVPNEYLQHCSGHPVRGVSTYPSEYLKLKSAKDISLVVYVKVFNQKYRGTSGCDGNQLAYASACVWNTQEKFRPIHGMIVVCLKPKTELEPDHFFNVMLHETLHVLSSESVQGYKTTEYEGGTAYTNEYAWRKQSHLNRTWRQTTYNWTMQDGTKKDIQVEFASTPTVMRVVESYFKCYQNRSQLFGAEVSLIWNGATFYADGAHWSVRMFPDEVLASLPGPASVLSNLTLAMLKDTGWYEVDMSKAQPLEFDASRVTHGEKEYCHLAWTSCWDVLKDVRDKWYQNESVGYLEFAGPYCDPTGGISTRACSSNGQVRMQCAQDGKYYMGCSIYLKNARRDGNSIDCTRQERTWEEIVARQRMNAYAYPAMCVSFTDYVAEQGKQKLINYPTCYEFRCTPETKSFDFHYFSIKGNCSVLQLCGVGKPSVAVWPSSCPFPYSGGVVCPDYVNVCEKRDGVGAIPWANPVANPGSDTEGTAAASSVNEVTGGILCFAVILACWH